MEICKNLRKLPKKIIRLIKSWQIFAKILRFFFFKLNVGEYLRKFAKKLQKIAKKIKLIEYWPIFAEICEKLLNIAKKIKLIKYCRIFFRKFAKIC